MKAAPKVPEWFYSQSSVIPYRESENGFEILLITTMKRKRWIVPKGVIDPGMTPRDSAVKEAWEEAGIRGRITGNKAIGSYLYRKWGGICTVQVFAFEVTETADDWPEAGNRDRRWMSIGEACELLDEPRLVEMVKGLAEDCHRR